MQLACSLSHTSFFFFFTGIDNAYAIIADTTIACHTFQVWRSSYTSAFTSGRHDLASFAALLLFFHSLNFVTTPAVAYSLEDLEDCTLSIQFCSWYYISQHYIKEVTRYLVWKIFRYQMVRTDHSWSWRSILVLLNVSLNSRRSFAVIPTSDIVGWRSVPSIYSVYSKYQVLDHLLPSWNILYIDSIFSYDFVSSLTTVVWHFKLYIFNNLGCFLFCLHLFPCSIISIYPMPRV